MTDKARILGIIATTCLLIAVVSIVLALTLNERIDDTSQTIAEWLFRISSVSFTLSILLTCVTLIMIAVEA